jgi:hypothetical protein
MISGTNPLGSNLPALDFTDPVALRKASIFALQENLSKKRERTLLTFPIFIYKLLCF